MILRSAIVYHLTSWKFLLQTKTLGMQHSSTGWPSFALTTLLMLKTGALTDTRHLPYILEYKSQNLRQNLDLKVGGATYTRVIK